MAHPCVSNPHPLSFSHIRYVAITRRQALAEREVRAIDIKDVLGGPYGAKIPQKTSSEA